MEKSVSEIVAEELCAIEVKKNVQFCFLSGAIRGAGELHFSPHGFILGFKHKNERFINLIAGLIERIYGEKIPVESNYMDLGYTHDLFYSIIVPKRQSSDVLDKCKIIKDSYDFVKGIPERFLERPAERKAFLRGLYLSCGSMKVPEHNDEGTGKKSGGYKLTLNLNSDLVKEDVINLIAKESMIEASSVHEKNTGSGIFLRSSEGICNLLTAMGCVESVLTVYEIVTARQVVNEVNRIRNCDMANIDKTVRAVSKQLDAIKKLKAAGIYDSLSAELKKTCELRMQFPDMGIEELGLRFDPPISKSCINHRLRRIIILAEDPNGEKRKTGEITEEE